jgi:hypothetical protein
MKAKFSERKYRILDFLHRHPGAKFEEMKRKNRGGIRRGFLPKRSKNLAFQAHF